MNCPMCNTDNVSQLPLEWMCNDCGVSTKFVFEPKGDEPNLQDLISQCWTKKVLGIVTPLGNRPSFVWSNSKGWIMSADVFFEPCVGTSPSNCTELLVTAFQVALGKTPNRLAQVESMYEEERQTLPDKAEENREHRLEKVKAWQDAVDLMGHNFYSN